MSTPTSIPTVTQPPPHQTPTASASASASASHLVLSTPELLTLICQHLPTHDLLTRLPLVSRTFHRTIHASPALQERLFLHGTARSPSRPNPLLQHVPAARRPRFVDKRDASWRTRRHRSSQLWPPAPAPGDFVSPLRPSDGAAGWRRAAFARPEASWRRMLVVVPPVRELWMTTEDGDGEVCHVDAGDDDWVRLGMLGDAAFAEWQTLGVTVTGEGWLLREREMTGGVIWYSLPPVLWPS